MLAQWGITEAQKQREAEATTVDSDPMRTSSDSIASCVLDSYAVSMSISSLFLNKQNHKVSIRCWCAYNYPGMVLTVGSDRFLSSELGSTYAKLCADPHEAILKTIAGGFHEVRVCAKCV